MECGDLFAGLTETPGKGIRMNERDCWCGVCRGCRKWQIISRPLRIARRESEMRKRHQAEIVRRMRSRAVLCANARDREAAEKFLQEMSAI